MTSLLSRIPVTRVSFPGKCLLELSHLLEFFLIIITLSSFPRLSWWLLCFCRMFFHFQTFFYPSLCDYIISLFIVNPCHYNIFFLVLTTSRICWSTHSRSSISLLHPYCSSGNNPQYTNELQYISSFGGARGVMVIVVGNGQDAWTRLIAFHIAQIPLEKVWIQLFSLQLWVNSRTYWVLRPWWGKESRRRKTLNWNLLNSA